MSVSLVVPLSVEDIDPITDGIDATADGAPIYKVSEVARCFLGKTSHWLRWAERRGFLTDPETAAIVGGRGEKGNRHYTIAEVERLVRVLAHHGAISLRHAVLGLEAVRIQAELHGMFDFEDHYEFEGTSYPLAVDDVAKIARRSPTWVRSHAERLGGVLRQWDETKNQEFWRFPEERLDERIYEIMGEP